MATQQSQSPANLFEELLQLRDRYRENFQGCPLVIQGKDLPVEKNRLGLMQWYLHPSIPKQAIRTLLMHVQVIPPGSRTGRWHFQGGQCIYVWEGKGHTILDGVRYDWKQEDVLNIPMRRDGVTIQHFNDDPNRRVRLVCCEANLVDLFGLDRGTRFEVLEEAP